MQFGGVRGLIMKKNQAISNAMNFFSWLSLPVAAFKAGKFMLLAVLLCWPSLANAGVVLSTPKTSIGVNNEGDLIFQGVGLRYVPTGGEALAPGCLCEGWGVADTITRRFAKAGRTFGRQNVTVESFTTDGESAKSVVIAADIMRVTHEFTESNSENLFRVLVSIENISDATIHLRYRRAMDWDVPPTTFSEMVTIVTNGASDVIFSSDNGFADGNPLNPAGSIAFVGEAVDNGPRDHGAVFDFDFGDLEPGATKQFVIYYGAAANEGESLDALAQVGAEVYSLGKPNPARAGVERDGTPNTFIFGFGGVGGKPIIRPLPDYSLGGLKVIDNGRDRPLDLEVRIGNAGHSDSEIIESVNVSFYDGDPADGGTLLGVREVQTLAPGRFEDVRLEDIENITSSFVHAVVDAEELVTECREQNNGQQIPFSSFAARGTIDVASGFPAYGVDEVAQLTATITNDGFFAYELNAQLRVEDAAGQLIHAFPIENLGVVESGASAGIAAEWATQGFAAGDYRVVAVLRDQQGNELDSSIATFIISETLNGQPIADLRTTTDRLQYHTTDSVHIMDLVRNISVSTMIDGAGLSLTVTGPDASLVLSTTVDVGSLAPGSFRELQTPLLLNAALQGLYQVNAELRYGSGTVLAVGNAGFEVVENLLLSLRGDVEAQLPVLFIGQTQICHYNIDNTGTLNLSAQPLWQVLVDVSDEMEIEAIQQSQDIAAGESVGLIRSVETAGLAAGDYACVLQATINGERQSLAHDVFRLEKPPIDLNVDFSLGDRGRLLVLLDDDKHCGGWGHDRDHDKDSHDGGHGWRHDDGRRHGGNDGKHRDHKRDDHGWHDKHGRDKYGDHCRRDDDKRGYGHREQPGLSEQRAWLEQVLDEAGWSYKLVTSQRDFSRELRSGGYAVYALLSEDVKLDNSTLEELREAVFRGEGLLVAGAHDERNSEINTVLGIKPAGKIRASGIEVLDTEFHTSAGSDFSERRHVLKARLKGAEVYARFTGVDPGRHDHDHGWKDRDDDDDDRKHDKHYKGYGNGHDWQDRKDDDDDRKDDWKRDDDKQRGRHHIDANIAIAGNAYGEGRSVYAGFDLLREATAYEMVATGNLFKALLLHALDTVHPETITPAFGDTLPLRLTIENLGIATTGRGVITLIAGSTVLDSGSAVAIGDDQLAWTFNLESGEAASVTIYVEPPYDDSAPLLFEALIQTGQAPDFVDYDTAELTVTPLAVPDIPAVLLNIDALQHPDHWIRQAEHRLRDAQRELERQRFERALEDLLKAADKLMQSRHTHADDIRPQIDALIKTVARQIDEKGGHWSKGGRDHD